MADLDALRALLDESDDEGPPRPVTPVAAPAQHTLVAPPPPPQLGPPPPELTIDLSAPLAAQDDAQRAPATDAPRREAPRKTCPACDAKVPARKARCGCGHVFVSKKQRAAAAVPPPRRTPAASTYDFGSDEGPTTSEACLAKLKALLDESDDEPAPVAKPKKKRTKTKVPEGGVPKPRGRAPAGATWDYVNGAWRGGARAAAAAPAERAAPPSAAPDKATLWSVLDGMVRGGDATREEAAAVLREYERLAPAGAPLCRDRARDRLLGRIETLAARPAPQADDAAQSASKAKRQKTEARKLARLERLAAQTTEGPRLDDYGIDGASGFELGNPLGLSD